MSAVEVERLAAVRVAVERQSPHRRTCHQIVVGTLAALVTVPPTLLGIHAVADRPAAVVPAPVERVIETNCVGDQLVDGVDIGRSDGALLARSTKETC